jgi:hypothetical protein
MNSYDRFQQQVPRIAAIRDTGHTQKGDSGRTARNRRVIGAPSANGECASRYWSDSMGEKRCSLSPSCQGVILDTRDIEACAVGVLERQFKASFAS